MLYTTLRTFKNNPVANFSKKTYVFLKKLILKFIFIVLKLFYLGCTSAGKSGLSE